MDVAFVSNVVYPYVKGGAEKRIYEIGHRLADRGHEVTVYGRHFWDGPATTSQDGMVLRGVSPERELYAGERRSITEALQFAKDTLVPLFRNRHGHDIVDASVFPYFPVLATRAGLVNQTPLVATWHEVWLDYWENYLNRLAPFGRTVERLTAKTPNEHVAVSGVTADRLARIGPPRNRIQVIPNGVDTDRVTSVEPATDGYDVLFVGRLISDKNVDILLDAFAESTRGGTETLGVIGDGPEREELESQRDRLACADRIDFLGFLDEYEDVLSHMRAADVFTSLSTREGFGITFVEALAASCPVICADHPESAATEIVDSGGFAIEPTVETASETLTAVLSGKQPPEDPAEVASRYNWERITDRTEAYYRDVIDDRR